MHILAMSVFICVVHRCFETTCTVSTAVCHCSSAVSHPSSIISCCSLQVCSIPKQPALYQQCSYTFWRTWCAFLFRTNFNKTFCYDNTTRIRLFELKSTLSHKSRTRILKGTHKFVMLCYVWHVLNEIFTILQIISEMTNVATIMAGCRDKSNRSFAEYCGSPRHWSL